MITYEQRNKYGLGPGPDPQWAKLDVDYYVKWLDITLPIGTIVQVELYVGDLADLFVNGEWVTWRFPCDAATLLEDEA